MGAGGVAGPGGRTGRGHRHAAGRLARRRGRGAPLAGPAPGRCPGRRVPVLPGPPPSHGPDPPPSAPQRGRRLRGPGLAPPRSLGGRGRGGARHRSGAALRRRRAPRRHRRPLGGAGLRPATRAVGANLWAALVLRDRHCRHPGCDRSPAWCEAHHVVPVLDGGSTCLSNLVLKCSRHHHLGHRPGWAEKLKPDGTLELTDPSGRSWETLAPGV